jgi:hypothetical protein
MLDTQSCRDRKQAGAGRGEGIYGAKAQNLFGWVCSVILIDLHCFATTHHIIDLKSLTFVMN